MDTGAPRYEALVPADAAEPAPFEGELLLALVFAEFVDVASDVVNAVSALPAQSRRQRQS